MQSIAVQTPEVIKTGIVHNWRRTFLTFTWEKELNQWYRTFATSTKKIWSKVSTFLPLFRLIWWNQKWTSSSFYQKKSYIKVLSVRCCFRLLESCLQTSKSAMLSTQAVMLWREPKRKEVSLCSSPLWKERGNIWFDSSHDTSRGVWSPKEMSLRNEAKCKTVAAEIKGFYVPQPQIYSFPPLSIQLVIQIHYNWASKSFKNYINASCRCVTSGLLQDPHPSAPALNSPVLPTQWHWYNSIIHNECESWDPAPHAQSRFVTKLLEVHTGTPAHLLHLLLLQYLLLLLLWLPNSYHVLFYAFTFLCIVMYSSQVQRVPRGDGAAEPPDQI